MKQKISKNKREDNMVLKIGHRGAAGYEPENTLPSFKKALELNVDLVELDVQACKSGELMVIHDLKVDRTTNGTGYVCEKIFNELRILDAGKKQTIPSLQEALDMIDKKAKVNIEIKSEGIARPVFNVILEYVKQKGWSWDDFLVSSFNHYELQKFSQLAPQVKTGAIIAGIPIGYAQCASMLKSYSLHPSKEFINQALVDDAHNRGLKVYAYTLNEPEDIQKVKLLGVDGIFSNFPDRI
ncbi:MAG: glycerophosphodiester phosphodiesterase [Candidatus Omnitrophica bacterium]|nr:glycerophosphodiester phosphodiesterase [Candidatus Omnitrophota bacterium]